MQERDRILELVKKGVLSTEEALVLLENIATEKDETLINKEAQKIDKTINKKQIKKAADTHKQEEVPVDNTDIDDYMEKLEANKKKDQEKLEEILAKLADQANETSVSIDELSQKIETLNEDIKEKKEAITVLNTMEELDGLTEVKEVERDHLEKDLAYLNETKEQLIKESNELKERLKGFKKEQKEATKDEWKNKFDIPDDWKEQANDTFNQVGDKLSEAGSQLGKFIKKTIGSVKTSVNDNVDWKDINIKVPGIASQSFTHEFVYPDNQATIIDVKVANGKVAFKTWDQEDVKVEADIKFYGKVDTKNLFEAFLERTEIDVDDDKISFQIPNKRIKVDLVFYLPTKNYDYLKVKMLNGDINLQTITLGDAFLKTTNGEITVKDVTASMIEIEGVNGEIAVNDSQIIDLLVDTVNGNIRTKSNITSTKLTLINGQIRVTVPKDSVPKKIETNAVNGTIKLALPKEIDVEGACKTNFGSIKNRLGNVEVIREKNDKTHHSTEFRRNEHEDVVVVNLTTTTGSILLKDTDN